jgi:hypothetical protein
MVDVPAETPVTIPLTEPTVATASSAELQTPPDVALLNVVVAPEHTVKVPIMSVSKSAFTVITFVAATLPQPFAVM